MPDIETVDVLTINCNTIVMQTQNVQIYNKTEDEWQCTNKTQEAGKPEKCSVNKTVILNSSSKDNATAIDNSNSKISFFIPVPQQEADKRTSAEIT